MVALDTLMGTDESIGFEDFLNGMIATGDINFYYETLFLYYGTVIFLPMMYLIVSCKPRFEIILLN